MGKSNGGWSNAIYRRAQKQIGFLQNIEDDLNNKFMGV
jgi:hypothetical protein